MTTTTFRVNGRLLRMTQAAHLLCSTFIAGARSEHIPPSMLGVEPDGTAAILKITCTGEEIDERREALFAEHLGKRFAAMVFFCEAWGSSTSADEPPPKPTSLEHDPKRLEIIVFDGRDDRGNLSRASALINREEGDGLAPTIFHPPELVGYVPSTSS